MNRNQEFYDLMEELENNVPDLQESVKKAHDRKKRLSFIYRPLASVAACFALFVLLVNFCAPVAYACSQVPILRELAAAVTFSRSLSDAVENKYVQQVDLTQTQNDITAEIDYLIVDQKQVNVFYRLNSDQYEQLEADPEVLTAEGDHSPSCGYHSNSFGKANGELRNLTIDFVDDDVPGKLRVQLNVYSVKTDYANQMPVPEQNVDMWELPEENENYLAQFDFLLEFDPQFTASGKIFPVNRIVEMDGQKITITQIEVYPTHLRVDVEDDPENTAWLKSLDFYIETDKSTKFEPISNGISATGSDSSPAMVSYRADSTFFYDADHIKLVITGARWLRKDMEKTWVNLLTGETGDLPEGTAFESAEKNGSTWTLTFRANHADGEPMYQAFGSEYYDADGKKYEINSTASSYGDPDGNGKYTYFLEQFPLRDYPYDEVWLSPIFSHNWVAENEIIIIVQ